MLIVVFFFSSSDSLDLILAICIFVLSVMFVIYEFIKIKIEGFGKYITSPRNLLELIRLTLIFIAVGMKLKQHADINIVVPLMFIFVYIKMLNYLACFKSIRHFVQMITEIIVDIKTFLVILVCSLIAYAQVFSYYTLQANGEI